MACSKAVVSARLKPEIKTAAKTASAVIKIAIKRTVSVMVYTPSLTNVYKLIWYNPSKQKTISLSKNL
jgi:hypothetical protein